ncbi:hypothetical protein ACWEPC_05670 [Nonomuraea sp. NPDC004297]
MTVAAMGVLAGVPAQVLDQRSGVVSGFIGAAGLVVAVAALLLRVRAGRGRSVGAVIAGNP